MKKKFFLNTVTSFVYQIAYMAYGFILPKLILDNYGSEVNGLVSSITQYISIISLTEFGVTAVIQASLYKPLVESDYFGISKVLTSASRFFRNIASIFVIYITVLCVVYPILVKNSFGGLYVSSLIVVLSVNMLVEYVFGIASKQLIIADQNLYFIQLVNVFTVLTNTFCCFFLVTHHVGIHVLKLCTAFIMILNSVASFAFVKAKYPKVRFNVTYEGEPIRQKWNGIAQHLSAYVYSSTDVVVLTLFSSLKDVSIYAVYNMVLNGLKQLTGVFDNAIRPVLGRLWAKRDCNLFDYFNGYEIIINLLSTFVFGCASCLIVPFVKIYTEGIQDARYIVPKFALIFTIAYFLQNIKNPYHTLVQSIGRFKETQVGYILSAGLNIFISVFLVFKYGLIGVAIGTAVAALFQFVYLYIYVHKCVFQEKMSRSMKVYLIDFVLFVVNTVIVKGIKIQVISIVDWVIFAILIALVWGISSVVVALLVYREKILGLYKAMKK